VNFRKIRRTLSLITIGILGTMLILLNPTSISLVLISMFAILTLTCKMNFCKIAFMLKRYAREASKLRSEIHTRLRMGFIDYSAIIDDPTQEVSKTGYIR
jgi:dolichol kinase